MTTKQKTKIKLRDFLDLYRKILLLVKQYRKYLYAGLVFIALTEIVGLGAQYFLKGIIDNLLHISEPGVLTTIIKLSSLMIGSYVILSIFEYFETTIAVRGEIKISHHLYLLIYQKLIDLSLGYHEKENTGAKLSKIEHGINKVQYLMEATLWHLIPPLIKIVTSFGFLMLIDYRMAISFLVIIPLFVWVTFSLNNRISPIHKKIRKGIDNVYGKLGQSIYNIKTVQSFVQEKREINTAKRGIVNIIANQFQFVKILFSFDFLRFNLITLGNLLVIVLGVYLGYRGEITAGELVVFINVANNVYYSLYGLTRVVDNVVEAKVGIERMFKILEAKETIIENKNAQKIDLLGKIEFQNVCFDYGEGSILKNVNLAINPGQTIALVGPSGGGKTTVAKLLYRFFDVKSGAIKIDGVDIRELDLEHYRTQLGIVTQDIDIFNDTVARNIAYGKPDANLTQIKKAAQMANAAEFIEKLKKKYQTIVGERGVKLSGGQRQRIGIARALLMNPKILIFDEATSSLDANSEKVIQDAIKKIIKNRTTVIIAHRLSTIKNADKIYVIDKGQIMESGTHEQLIKKSGLYKKLIELQISAYEN